MLKLSHFVKLTIQQLFIIEPTVQNEWPKLRILQIHKSNIHLKKMRLTLLLSWVALLAA